MHVKLYLGCELLKYGVVQQVFLFEWVSSICVFQLFQGVSCTALKNCVPPGCEGGKVLLSKTVKGQQTVAGDL